MRSLGVKLWRSIAILVTNLICADFLHIGAAHTAASMIRRAVAGYSGTVDGGIAVNEVGVDGTAYASVFGEVRMGWKVTKRCNDAHTGS